MPMALLRGDDETTNADAIAKKVHERAMERFIGRLGGEGPNDDDDDEGGRHPRRRRTLFCDASRDIRARNDRRVPIGVRREEQVQKEVALKNGLPPLLGGFNEERDADDAYYSLQIQISGT